MQGRGLVKVPAYFIDFIEDLIMKFKLYRSISFCNNDKYR